ncbi:MAG: hypothetical protein IJC71_01140 [Clostridia bacterium]|nr:hypothetical protein [Clostridia bacterium]
MKELPKRKSTRLKDFDYSSAGAYFVTVCTRDRMQILSEIVQVNHTDTSETQILSEIVTVNHADAGKTQKFAVGEGLAPPEFWVKLKPCGEIAQEQLRSIEVRFPNISIEDYIIMPDHIHVLICLHESAGGASPSPTLDDVICVFKSLTSRICKQQYGIEKMFQRSSAEHIIRSREDYETHRKYIDQNPMRWYYKHSASI